MLAGRAVHSRVKTVVSRTPIGVELLRYQCCVHLNTLVLSDAKEYWMGLDPSL